MIANLVLINVFHLLVLHQILGELKFFFKKFLFQSWQRRSHRFVAPVRICAVLAVIHSTCPAVSIEQQAGDLQSLTSCFQTELYFQPRPLAIAAVAFSATGTLPVCASAPTPSACHSSSPPISYWNSTPNTHCL